MCGCQMVQFQFARRAQKDVKQERERATEGEGEQQEHVSMAESARRRNVPPALTATASGRSIRRRKEGAAGGGDKTGGRMEHRCHVWMAFNLQAARREMGSSRKRERERERGEKKGG